MCPHMLLYKCWLIYILHVSSNIYTRAELLLYIPAAIAWASIHMCPHIYRRRTIDVSSYTGTLYIRVLIYRRRTTSLYSGSDRLGQQVPQCCSHAGGGGRVSGRPLIYICVIYVCPHTAVYGGSSSPLNTLLSSGMLVR